MRKLRHRIRTIVARVRAGDGAHVVADAAETAELWLTSGVLPLPRPLREPLGHLGTILGDLGRDVRPAPRDVPPPAERAESRETTRRVVERTTDDRTALERKVHAPPSNGKRERRAEAPRSPSPAKPVDAKPAAAKTAAAKTAAARTATVKQKPKPAKSTTKPAGAKAKPASRTGGSKTGRGKAAPEPAEQQPRVSARRSPAKKRPSGARTETAPSSEPSKRSKANGKGRSRPPAARRGRDDKSEKPT